MAIVFARRRRAKVRPPARRSAHVASWLVFADGRQLDGAAWTDCHLRGELLEDGVESGLGRGWLERKSKLCCCDVDPIEKQNIVGDEGRWRRGRRGRRGGVVDAEGVDVLGDECRKAGEGHGRVRNCALNSQFPP
jgi:hypothetical protein